MTERAPSDRQRLLDLFSLAANSNVELVVYEIDEPDAPAALRAWAMSVELRVNETPDGIGGTVWLVQTVQPGRGVRVYSRAA